MEQMAKGEIPAPVSITIDPTNICNVNCCWCIWDDFRRRKPTSIPDNVLLEMPEFLAKWGVKSVCVGGGGEPFCHPKITELLLGLHKNGISVGTITNGLAIEKEDVRKAVVETCRWIGFSVDAASPETYQKIKKPKLANTFNRVLENISWVCRNRRDKKRPQVGMKFVIHHLNYGEVYRFAELAKGLGADEVHFRPVFLPNYKFTKGVRKTVEFYLRESRKDLEDDNFKVYGIVHKFDKDWVRAIRFKKCRATPITGYFLADGTFSICCDRRDDPACNLGKYYPFEELTKKWGSKEHKDMIEKIVPQSCPRCTQTITNEVIEKVIIEDEMTYEFV